MYAHGELVSGDALAGAERGFTVRHDGDGWQRTEGPFAGGNGGADRRVLPHRRARRAGGAGGRAVPAPAVHRRGAARRSRSTATSGATRPTMSSDSRLASWGGGGRGARRGIPAALGPAARAARRPVPPPRPRRGRTVRRVRGGGPATAVRRPGGRRRLAGAPSTGCARRRRFARSRCWSSRPSTRPPRRGSWPTSVTSSRTTCCGWCSSAPTRGWRRSRPARSASDWSSASRPETSPDSSSYPNRRWRRGSPGRENGWRGPTSGSRHRPTCRTGSRSSARSPIWPSPRGMRRARAATSCAPMSRGRPCASPAWSTSCCPTSLCPPRCWR